MRSRIYPKQVLVGINYANLAFTGRNDTASQLGRLWMSHFFKSHAKIVENGRGHRSHPFQALYFTDEETVLQTWNEKINISQRVYDKVRTKTISSPRIGPVPLCHANHTQQLSYKEGAWERSLTFNPLFSTYRLVPITFFSSIEYMACWLRAPVCFYRLSSSLELPSVYPLHVLELQFMHSKIELRDLWHHIVV